MPETSTCGPALTPWLKSGELGAFAVVMICRAMTVLPVRARLKRISQDRRLPRPLRSLSRATPRPGAGRAAAFHHRRHERDERPDLRLAPAEGGGNDVVVAATSSGARRCGNDVVGRAAGGGSTGDAGDSFGDG